MSSEFDWELGAMELANRVSTFFEKDDWDSVCALLAFTLAACLKASGSKMDISVYSAKFQKQILNIYWKQRYDA